MDFLMTDQWTKKEKGNVFKWSVFICCIYVVIFGSIHSFQWYAMGISYDENADYAGYFDSSSIISDSQRFVFHTQGKMMGETAQKLISGYKKLLLAELNQILAKEDLVMIHNCLIRMMPDLQDTRVYKTMFRIVERIPLAGLVTRPAVS